MYEFLWNVFSQTMTVGLKPVALPEGVGIYIRRGTQTLTALVHTTCGTGTSVYVSVRPRRRRGPRGAPSGCCGTTAGGEGGEGEGGRKRGMGGGDRRTSKVEGALL